MLNFLLLFLFLLSLLVGILGVDNVILQEATLHHMCILLIGNKSADIGVSFGDLEGIKFCAVGLSSTVFLLDLILVE